MTDLERLTAAVGGPRRTAELLGVTERSYWNYRGGRIPRQVEILISRELEARGIRPPQCAVAERSENGSTEPSGDAGAAA